MSKISRSLIEEAKTVLTQKRTPLAEATSNMAPAFLSWYKQMLRDTDKQLDKAAQALDDAITELEDYDDIDGLGSDEKRACAAVLKKLSDILNQLEKAADNLPRA